MNQHLSRSRRGIFERKKNSYSGKKVLTKTAPIPHGPLVPAVTKIAMIESATSYFSLETLTTSKTAIKLAVPLLIILAEASAVAVHSRGSNC